MNRGDIVLVDFDPAQGSEANKRRPAVIVSNDGANAYATRTGRGTVTVVPLTSRIGTGFPVHVTIPAAVPGLRVDSTAQAEQVRTVATSRVEYVMGHLPTNLIDQLDQALRLHLAL